ncbi:TetR/AcrR family transcriptional regulator [Nocardia otitidiscaviarum]|uniref:TetR/AcrR family transcriptional regulator n=1 Tax=Nocardia otitidiscaviarum TaxID=1823 RepID=UPI0018952826|nr:TetR family transcriptional regulator [Nocardia otitidiscaviarum]MBF6179219.1 TetR family transcriptional regulator [Nocardia otitidiscaviarum]
MSTPPDRRTRIVDTAIDLIATQGLRALTHRALDAALTLPAGSTSYYFRTKRALIDAIVDRIHTRSRDDFSATLRDPAPGTSPGEVARGIAHWLDDLLLHRRNHLIARHALIIELADDGNLHPRLVNSLFSPGKARELFAALGSPTPELDAANFLAILEGLLFDRYAGARLHLHAGTTDSIAQLTRAVRLALHPGQ